MPVEDCAATSSTMPAAFAALLAALPTDMAVPLILTLEDENAVLKTMVKQAWARVSEMTREADGLRRQLTALREEFRAWHDRTHHDNEETTA